MPGCGVVAGWTGRSWDGEPVSPSSEKMRPIVERGFWIVRRSPATGAEVSSSLDWEASVRLGLPGWGWVGPRDVEGWLGVLSARDSDSRFCSAIAETAASTLRSNSPSLTVRLVRSSVSMNWMAPDCVGV